LQGRGYGGKRSLAPTQAKILEDGWLLNASAGLMAIIFCGWAGGFDGLRPTLRRCAKDGHPGNLEGWLEMQSRMAR